MQKTSTHLKSNHAIMDILIDVVITTPKGVYLAALQLENTKYLFKKKEIRQIPSGMQYKAKDISRKVYDSQLSIESSYHGEALGDAVVKSVITVQGGASDTKSKSISSFDPIIKQSISV